MLESPENLMNYISDKIKEVLLKIFRKKNPAKLMWKHPRWRLFLEKLQAWPRPGALLK